VIDLLEWQYDKSTKDQKDRPVLSDWLQNHINNIDEAPISIQHHLQSLTPSEPPEAGEAPPEASNQADMINLMQMQSLQQLNQAATPPNVNKGAVKAPDQKTILDRAMTDQNYYNQNADAIRQAWMSKFGKRR